MEFMCHKFHGIHVLMTNEGLMSCCAGDCFVKKNHEFVHLLIISFVLILANRLRSRSWNGQNIKRNSSRLPTKRKLAKFHTDRSRHWTRWSLLKKKANLCSSEVVDTARSIRLTGNLKSWHLRYLFHFFVLISKKAFEFMSRRAYKLVYLWTADRITSSWTGHGPDQFCKNWTTPSKVVWCTSLFGIQHWIQRLAAQNASHWATTPVCFDC